MRLKKHYSSREVAALTGLTARQLQWWDRRGVFAPSIRPHRTEAGGYTERRYTPVELLELMVLADLRRRGFSLGRVRRLLEALRRRFDVRLFEAIEGGGPVTLFVDGKDIYARTDAGELYNVLDDPTQPLLVLGQEPRFRQLTAREHHARPRIGVASRKGTPPGTPARTNRAPGTPPGTPARTSRAPGTPPEKPSRGRVPRA